MFVCGFFVLGKCLFCFSRRMHSIFTLFGRAGKIVPHHFQEPLLVYRFCVPKRVCMYAQLVLKGWVGWSGGVALEGLRDRELMTTRLPPLSITDCTLQTNKPMHPHDKRGCTLSLKNTGDTTTLKKQIISLCTLRRGRTFRLKNMGDTR